MADAERLTDGSDKPVITPTRWRVAMVLLLSVYILNFLDRQIINILAEPIKQDLQLADWQLGLLTGFAFALFYALAGIPIARYAERGNRRNIISAAVVCWSGFTMLCGVAGNFVQLLFFRFGVGIGEAGGVPPAHSLITEITPRENRASALAFFHLGLPLGALFGLVFGGIILDLSGWRMAFLVAGAPGILVAILVFAFLPEPRMATGLVNVKNHQKSNFFETLAYLIRKQTFVLVLLAATCISFATYAHQAFSPAFFFRVHGPEMAEIAARFGLQAASFLGIAFGLITGAAGGFGLWLGGKLADSGSTSGLTDYCTVPAIALVVFVPIQIGAFVSPSFVWSLIGFIPSIMLASMWIAPMQATIQSVAPEHMRATASATVLLSMNLVGLGLGPLILGIISDVMAGSFGLATGEALRWALTIVTVIALISSLLFWRARRHIQQDVEG